MGNSSSIEEDESLEMETQGVTEDVDPDENLLDFSSLFDTEALHKALLTIKEPPGNILIRYKEPLIKWLKTLVDREETTINMVQFVDFLSSKAPREEAIEMFNDLDTEEEGVINITRFLGILKDAPLEPMQALHPCYELPGPLHVYLGDLFKLDETAKKVLQFIHRHRVDSDKLVMPLLGQMNSVIKQRAKLFTGRYYTLKHRESDHEFLRGTDEVDEQEENSGAERQLIKKCYCKVTVSSNSKSVENLLDSRTDSYWQSSGTPRNHWIRVQMLPGVMVKELALSVISSDDSYMPKLLTVSVGNTENSLREVKKLTVPRETNGKFMLVRNLSTEYRFIQINIRGCYNEGCDVKIRGLHIKGCKFTKEIEPTVLDTMAVWYLGIVGSTAQAALPVAPHLRQLILSHSKTALSHLPPLSISPFSPSKPEFLSSFVVKEMEAFLMNICLPEGEMMEGESLEVLLSFALAHGNVNNIIDLIMILFEHLSMEIAVIPLLRKMESILQQKNLKHAESLKMCVVKCDGGQKSDEHKPDIIFSNVPNSCYISDKDNKIVTVIAKEESDHLISVTRIKVKVQSGDQGAKAGLVFLSTIDPTGEEFAEQLKRFGGWTAEDYKNRKSEETDLRLIAYFEVDEESNEVDFVPDVIASGNYIVLKFLGPRKDEADKVGVQSVQVFGHKYSDTMQKSLKFLNQLDSIAGISEDNERSGSIGCVTLIIRLIHFIGSLMRDMNLIQARRKAASLDITVLTESHLSVENLSLEKIWKLYMTINSNTSDLHVYGSLLCLYLLRTALPYIKPLPSKIKNNSTSSSDPLSIPSTVLAHLCHLLDSPGTQETVRWLAKDIVTEGVVVFFPDAKARKDYLLFMIGSVLEENQPPSWWLKFEALCHYFSKSDSKSLLNLPSKPTDVTSEKTEPALSILNTMIKVAKREALSCLKSNAVKPDDLIRLLSALQASLFFWCQGHLSTESKEQVVTKNIGDLVVRYVEMMVDHCAELLRELDKEPDAIETRSKALEKTLLGRVLPEMLVCLSTMVDTDIDRLSFLNHLMLLLRLLTPVTSHLPSSITKASENDSAQAVESVVGLWTRESSHNYENNSRVSEEFHCPSAVRFSLDFDSRCCTERRYDYLEFTDESGSKYRCDGEIGQERWPTHLEFKGQKVHFKFYSDSSNNEWGYKFTLKAYGHTFSSVYWLSDLSVSLCHLLGQLCSSVLTTRGHSSKQKELNSSEGQRQDELLLDSDLWKTLFRGGYMIRKLTRSLSGAYSAKPADAKLSAVLNDLANGPEGPGVKLVELCRETLKGQYYGGQLVDAAVNTVFAALIWNSQECREELTVFAAKSDANPTLTPGLLSAFKFAEFMRRDLVEARQKLIESKESEEDKEKKSSINEDAPVIACTEKANYLLKFSGVSRVPLEKTEGDSSHRSSRPNWANKGKNWNKISTAVNTITKLKQHLQESSEREKINSKYPSFELVLNFVRTESLSVDQVHSLLDQRSDMARMVATAYNHATEVVTILGVRNLFELPGLMYLQQLLYKQRHFPKHYAAKLDGCGLDLENEVRKSYRKLMLGLIESYKSYSNPPTRDHTFSRLLVLLYILHLLDFDWQDYDHALLQELNLPELFLTSAINSSTVKEQQKVVKFEGEDEMLRRYEFHMKLLKRVNDESSNIMQSLLDSAVEGEHKDTCWFLASIRHKYPSVSVQCDNCSKEVGRVWYVDLDSDSHNDNLDLCSDCFKSGEESRPSCYDKEHKFQLIGGFICNGCEMHIITHRFHSRLRYDYDLCIGCFRKEEANCPSDEWTVYLLTEQPATPTHNRFLSHLTDHATGLSYKDGVLMKLGPSSDLGIYAQQHCWLLFSTLTVSMAHAVNTNSRGSEVEYIQQACNIMQLCLKYLAFILRSALLFKLDEVKSKVEDKPLVVTTPPPSSRIVVDTSSHLSVEKECVTDTPTLVDSKDTPTVEAGVRKESELLSQLEERMEEESRDESMEVDAEDTYEKMETDGVMVVDTERSFTTMDVEPSPIEVALEAEVRAKEEVEVEVRAKEEVEAEVRAKEEVEVEVRAKEEVEVEVRAKEEVEVEVRAKEDGEMAVREETDPVVLASRKYRDMDATIGDMEKMYGVLHLEKSLGLLAAILSHEMTLEPWLRHQPDIQLLLVKELLPTLLQLACYQTVQESQRLQSLLVVTRYLAHLNPRVADCVIDMAHGIAEQSETWSHGTKTVQFLFSMGEKFLRKSQFSGAATCAECLLLLSKANPWKSAVTITLGKCLETLPQDMDLSSIFGLLVMSGFPRVPREGGVVSSSHSGKPLHVVLSKVDNNNASGFDVSTMKPIQIKLSDYEFDDTLRGCINSSKLPTLLSLLKHSLQLSKQESEKQVEHMWILALLLKALHFIIQTSSSSDVIQKLLDTGLIPILVKLASKPTHVSKKWYLTDLEVLGISSYLPQKTDEALSKKEVPMPTAEKKEEEKEEEEKEKEEKTGKDVENEVERESRVLEGLNEEDGFMLKAMTEVFLCDLSVLRAMYDSVDGDMEKLMASTEKCYVEGEFKPPPDIMEAAKRWKRAEVDKTTPQDLSMSMEDTGVTRISTIELDIKNMEAIPEDPSIFKKTKHLLKDTEKHFGQGQSSSSEDGVLKREDSYKLLWEELGKKEPQTTRENLHKTIQGVAVLRARLVLASLLKNWPEEGPRLSTTFLGCSDIIHYFCLLDLLLHQQTKQEREELLVKVLTCSERTEVFTLAITTAQCMNKVAISKEIREFTHKGKADGKIVETGKIVINNATSLDVTYHPINGLVEFSNSPSMSDHHKKVTGSVTESGNEEKHIIPGDTLHYKVELEGVSEAKYPRYCFIVTGTQDGRFDTGFLILSMLMDQNHKFVEWLPLKQLWPLLIGVACQHTGKERLKVVGLLMEIINLQSKEGDEKKRLELSALKPLWQLYTTITKEYDSRVKTQQSLSPDIVRMLTELFLSVENLSEEWGISQELMVETLTKEGLNKWLEKGISNVAFVSLALGIDNLAARTFTEEKRKYVPVKKKEVKVILEELLEEDDDDDDDDEDLDDEEDGDSTYDSYSDY